MSRTFFLVIVAALALCWGRAAARSGAGARVLPGLAEAGLGWLRRHPALPDPSRIDRRSTTGFGTKRRVVEEVRSPGRVRRPPPPPGLEARHPDRPGAHAAWRPRAAPSRLPPGRGVWHPRPPSARARPRSAGSGRGPPATLIGPAQEPVGSGLAPSSSPAIHRLRRHGAVPGRPITLDAAAT